LWDYIFKSQVITKMTLSVLVSTLSFFLLDAGGLLINGSCQSTRIGARYNFYENGSPVFYCYGSGSTTTDSLVFELDTYNGENWTLGVCSGINTTTTNYSYSTDGVHIAFNNPICTLSMLYIKSKFSGVLRCKETLKTGGRNETSCNIHAGNSNTTLDTCIISACKDLSSARVSLNLVTEHLSDHLTSVSFAIFNNRRPVQTKRKWVVLFVLKGLIWG
jgi:hypothetical protein